MHIRPATHADAPTIAAIWEPILRDTCITFDSVPRPPENIVERIDGARAAGHEFFVAEHDDVVVGFGTYYAFRGTVGYAHTCEHSVFLTDAAKGIGAGRALMEAIEIHAKSGGVHSMFAVIWSGNTPAVGFHAALGYDHVCEMKQVGRKFDTWLDAVFMQKML